MDIGGINSMQNAPDLADVARYGLLGSHPLYSEKRARVKAVADENRTGRAQQVLTLAMTGYTRDGTRRNTNESGQFFNRCF